MNKNTHFLALLRHLSLFLSSTINVTPTQLQQYPLSSLNKYAATPEDTYSCGQSKPSNLVAADYDFFGAKLMPDLNSGSENTSNNSAPIFFPQCFCPAKFLGSLKNVVYPFGGSEEML